MQKESGPGEIDLKAVYRFSSKHHELVMRSKACHCFDCLAAFPPGDITHWITEPDGQETAQCPRCGMDTVLPDAAPIELTPQLVLAMKNRWCSEA